MVVAHRCKPDLSWVAGGGTLFQQMKTVCVCVCVCVCVFHSPLMLEVDEGEKKAAIRPAIRKVCGK